MKGAAMSEKNRSDSLRLPDLKAGRDKSEEKKHPPRRKRAGRRQSDWWCGFILLLMVAAACFYGFYLSPYEPGQLIPNGRLQPPSTAHLMGTDHLSRDLLTRVGQGTAATLIVAVGVNLFAGALGLLLGALAGYFGGAADWLVLRLTDTLLAFPGILMALLLLTVMGRGLPQLILALGLAFTPSYARITRSAFRLYRGRDFVKRLEVMGAPPWRILFIHLAPLLREQYRDAVGIGLANAILAESGMSFLGFGTQEPWISWGVMLSEARAYLFRAPWQAIFPGLAIITTVFGIFLLARGRAPWRKGGENLVR